MNYAIAFLALILLFALIYWFAGGRRWYTGPLIEAEVDENDSAQFADGASSGSDVGAINEKTEKHGQIIQ